MVPFCSFCICICTLTLLDSSFITYVHFGIGPPSLSNNAYKASLLEELKIVGFIVGLYSSSSGSGHATWIFHQLDPDTFARVRLTLPNLGNSFPQLLCH